MDFYKFVLKKRTNLKIAFSHEPINSDYTFGTVRLYSEESGGVFLIMMRMKLYTYMEIQLRMFRVVGDLFQQELTM